MKRSGPIKLGIIGLGRAGKGMHAAELEGKESKFIIAAVCDVVPERMQLFRDQYGARPHSNMAELLSDPDVEVVCIATRSMDHFDHASVALRAGKHVFLEKPMTTRYSDAVRLRAIARKSKGKLLVRHNRYWEPCFQHVNEIIASNVLGDVFEIRLRRNNYLRRDDWQTIKKFGGGQLLNWGPHIIQHALHFINYQVKDMWSHLRRVAAAGDAEDFVKILLLGRNGRLIDLEISGGTAIGGPVYFIAGTKGALVSQDEQTISLRYLDPGKPLPAREAQAGTPAAMAFGSPEDLPWIERTIPVAPAVKGDMTSCWDALYDAIRLGKPFPVSLDNAVDVMRIVSRARRGTPFE